MKFDRELLDSAPPHDEEAERAVVGGIMVAWHEESCGAAAVIRKLDAWDFHSYYYGRLFVALRKMWHSVGRFGGDEAVMMAEQTGVHAADIAEALYDCQPRRLGNLAARLRALRISRERIFVAVELLQASYTSDSWDDATRRNWICNVRMLIANMERAGR